MDEKQLALLIDRMAKALAIQAVQIRAMQSILMERGVQPDELTKYQNINKKQSFNHDVQFFRRHLLGHFPRQARTEHEEKQMLNEWLNQGSLGPPEESEGPDPSTPDQDT